MQIQYHSLFRGLAVAVCLLAGGAISLPAAEKEPTDADLKVWTDGKVAQWRPTAAERRFDEIGWSESLTAARQLSSESGRPVFLFTLDGRIAIGRC
ncbi:MAG TPA: hypothetical protein VMP01_06535 [Pirellulaceae bacterium]|nr:hypothetical protein [Pirellulaceae bacterium]